MMAPRASADRLKALLEWFELRGVTYEPTINLKMDPNGAISVFSTPGSKIEEGSVLCTIPKDKGLLSIRTSPIADLLEGGQESLRIGGGLALIAATLHEVSLGPASQWFGYLQSLPQREHLPVFWSKQELGFLRGSDAANRIATQNDGQAMDEDFQQHVAPWAAQFPECLRLEAFDLESFRNVASWIASRAFGVDDYHGMSLVPLADAFNHKAAHVRLTDDYAVEGASSDSDEDAGSESGSEGAADSGSGGGEESGEESGEDGDAIYNEETGFCDNEGDGASGGGARGNITPHNCIADAPNVEGIPLLRPRISGAAAAGEGSDPSLRLDIGICSGQRDGVEVLEIVAAQDLKDGQQIYNCYGELSNTELVLKYGFALLSNPFSTVELDKAVLVEAARAQLGAKAFSRRHQFLLDHSELLSEEEEPFEVLPDAALGPACVAGLYILFAPEPLFRTWKTVDDAVQSLHSAKAQAATDQSEPAEGALLNISSNAELLDGDRVADACNWLSDGALGALSEALRIRAASYPEQPASIQSVEVEAAGGDQGGGGAENGIRRLSAARAAFILVSEEQRILADSHLALSEGCTAKGVVEQKSQNKRKADQVA